MAEIRHLSQAPISEALIDIRVSLELGFDGTRLLAAKEPLRARYPLAVEQRGLVASFNFPASVPSGPQVQDMGLRGVQFKAPDEKTVAQFRVDGFTLNRLRPYTSWDEILPEARDLWSIYRDIAKPRSVSRLSARYINHIALPSDQRSLEDFFVTGPMLPDGIPPDLTGFAMRTNVQDASRDIAATITQVLEPPMQSSLPTLLLDIDAFRASEISPEWEVLEPILADLRSYKNQIFFGSLTDALVETFV